ncbi:MAG: sigma-54-dependent Fis family transcriptional regulator, partial [Planctomycetes bacterium]|nr:sigma-54-dependent Fis family transcriptional regulator [Planctomycetota bacterium]
MYADCTRAGAVLSAEDLQRVAFCSRMLATALGNRVLVRSLLAHDGAPSGGHWALATTSPACAEFVERVKLYAPADYTVLLRGETGTGKEVVARALHDLSRRQRGPFVPVNCAAIPEQLMESMLFGHEKGSFTGAQQARRGHFEEAHGGTIFLDEIGDMAHELQAKILRVLQDRVVTPIGGRRQVRVDVRILAATHQDLERMVREGRFREDLYYRLRELEIVLPPLRERREDLPLLVGRFLGEAAAELGYPEAPQLTEEALARLYAEPWRGNIRELRHVVKGAALRSGGRPLRVEHLDLDRARTTLPDQPQ